MLNKNYVLLTGASGSLGRCIFSILKNAHINVTGTSRSFSSDLDYERGDLLDVDFIASLFKKYPITHVIHCASSWSGRNLDPDITINNSISTINLLKNLPLSIKKIVYISSSAVYEGHEIREMNESIDNLSPVSSYGISKLFCENMVKMVSKKIGCMYTIWRPIHIVSPFEVFNHLSSHITTNLFHSIINNLPVNKMNMDKKIEFTWVGDVAECIVKTINDQRSNNEIFNISSVYKYTIRTLISNLMTEMSRRGFIVNQEEILDIDEPEKSLYAYRLNKILDIRICRLLLDCVNRFLDCKY